MKRRKMVFVIGLVLLLAFGASGSVYAQESDEPEEFVLEEVSVTATKRIENLQKIPLSGTSITGETMQQTGRTIINDMLKDSAGVEIRATQQNQGIFIRGIGENVFGMGIEQNVVFSVNGMNPIHTWINRMSQLDVARVEVVRGPDSTLNGRQALGGSVTVITNKPTHSFEGNASFTAGSYDLFISEGVVNSPVNEKIALRAAAQTVKKGPLLSNGGGDLDSFTGRLRALYDPTDKLEIILSGEYVTTGGMGRGINSYTTPIDLTKPFTTPLGPFYNPTKAPSYEDTQAYNYYADITYDFGWASLYFQPTYQKVDLWSAAYNRGYAGNSTDPDPDTWSLLEIARAEEQTSYELRLTSTDEGQAFNWLAGYYYLEYEQLQEFMMHPPNQPTAPTLAYPVVDSTSNNIDPKENGFWLVSNAFYGTVTYDFTDTLSLTAGGRYTSDEKRRPASVGSSYYYYLDDGIPNSTTGERVFFGVTAETRTMHRFDYKISLQKDLTPASMLYFLVSTGYKAGAYNIVPADPEVLAPGYSPFFGPEYLTNYEIGSKNQLLSNTLRLNASVFYYDYADIQLNFRGYPVKASTGVDPDWTRAVKENAGKAVCMGFEVETDYLLTPWDRIGLNISYLNTEITETKYEPVAYLKGEELPESPNWRISPRYRHRFDLGSWGELTADIDGTYVTDARYWVPSETNLEVGDPYNVRDAYFKANATLTYLSQNGQWSLTGYVKNLFDKQTYDDISPPSRYTGYANVTFKVADPRMFGITLAAHF